MTPWEFPGWAAPSLYYCYYCYYCHYSYYCCYCYYCLWAHPTILGPQTTLPRNCLEINYLGVT